ncbi:MAG: 3-hydroxybutyrate dehydrogenase [SAR202 cluster bacterium]|nr:3-hydroxybutyrate dehydrogenase [SAR202 cluster bacterium]
MDTSLKGRVALITGGGSGIGKAIATRFAASGAKVIVNDMRDEGVAVANDLKGAFIKANLADMEETRQLAKKAVGLEGRVDILVNNAGYQNVAPVDEFPEEVWAQMVQVMLVAPFQLTKYVVPGMKAQKWGRIINMASIHGLVASPYKSAYNAAKHGIVGLTKTVALEVGEFGITVNAICPGYTRTPLVEAQLESQAKTFGITPEEVVRKIMLEPAAIKRMIEPEEIAGLARFLASDEARSITGASYAIDLGWTAR